MIKSKVFRVLFFLFLVVGTSLLSLGNTNTEAYSKELFDSAKKEFLLRNYVKSTKYLNQIQSMPIDNNLKTKVINLHGVIYKNLGDYGKAMDYYLEAYKLALEHHLIEMEAAVLNNMALLHAYKDKGDYEMALKYYQKSYEVGLRSKDSISIGLAAINITQIAIELENIALAEEYLPIAEIHLQSEKRYAIHAQIVKSNFLLLKKEYAAAKTLVIDILNNDSEVEIGQKYPLFKTLSKISQATGALEDAIYYMQQLLCENLTIDERVDVYERLSELYEGNNSWVLVSKYKDSLLLAKDSLHKINDKERVAAYQIRLDLMDAERALAENRTKQKTERILLVSILIFIAFIAIILIWVFRIQSIRNKQSKQIVELELQQEKNQNLLEQEQFDNEKLRLKQQLKEQETIALLEQERLQNEVNEKLLLKQRLKEEEMMRLLEQERLNNEIEIKNKQLLVKALSQSDRDELLKEMLSLLSNISQQSDNPQLDITMRKLKAQLKKSTDWDGFLTQFERINPSFFYSLKEEFPTLTTNDIHLLSYIYLNLDTQKISDLLNISIETCQKKKLRLANKMGLKTTELHVFLVNKIKFHIPK